MSTHISRLELELTSACDHRCRHCYNVWNAPATETPEAPAASYPRGLLPLGEYLPMVEQLIADSGASHVTITGGEPLLRPDALEVIERVTALVKSVQLVTNGSHLDADAVARLARAKLRSVQLTLLSSDRERHDALKGAPGSFDATVRAALDLREAGVLVQACFVATRATAGELAGVLELCLVLGVRSLSYNRMSPAGAATEVIDELLPHAEQVEADLAVAHRLGQRYKIHVATAMPIPPCLVRIDRYPHIRFGFCSTAHLKHGTSKASLVIDPLGNARSCNLASERLGNLREQPWRKIVARLRAHATGLELPPICRGCYHVRSCGGGCPEAALATYGSARHPEPFLHQALTKQRGR